MRIMIASDAESGVPGPRLVFVGQADGAIPNGTRIVKCNSAEGDTHQDGAGGVVFSSVATPQDMRDEFPEVEYGYWVLWDDMPTLHVAITSDRIKLP